MVDGYGTQLSYLVHLAPIFAGLPAERRGTVYVEMNYHELLADATQLGVNIAFGRPPGRDTDPDPVLIAGGSNLQAGWSGRPVVFVEHGAGQTYAGLDVASYSGGAGRDMVSLFLCPNQKVCDRNLARYPHADAEAVGDPTIIPTPVADGPPVVAFSWHFDFPGGPPEAGCTFAYWEQAVLEFVRSGRYEVLGHAHPKLANRLMPWYAAHDIPATRRFSDVVARAAVYVVDNSSTIFEWAALDRPVVVLDAPQYRRDVELGLRFWECADVGVRIEETADLPYAIDAALADPAPVARRRRQIVAQVYAAIGEEAKRESVEAILSRWP